jgi:polysaccharide export outer membrane protein
MVLQRLPIGMILVFLALALPTTQVGAQQASESSEPAYTIQPGDMLQISVWQEPDLQEEVLIAPDGGIAFPLVGEMSVIGKSIVELREDISERLSRYISEPIVTVTIRQVLGNKIYVIGQVNRPGEFVVNPMVDVVQALSMAGGTTPYASLNNISILRRRGTQQTSIPFKYGDISSGKNLETNIILQSGDVVIVP